MAEILNTPKIIFLNGPPHIGKDTIAKAFVHLGELWNLFHQKETDPRLVVRTYKMARLLKLQVLYDHGYQDIEAAYEFFEKRENKDTPQAKLNGKSFRQQVIFKSEEDIKHRNGMDFYGRYLAEKMNRENMSSLAAATDYQVNVISDSGFECEAPPVIETFGADNCVLVRLHDRDESKYDFKKDSRSYINLPIRTLDFYNERIEDIRPSDMCVWFAKILELLGICLRTKENPFFLFTGANQENQPQLALMD